MRIEVRRSLVLVLILGCLFGVISQRVLHAATRGTECYTAWDDYYFYAAFQVDDPHVNSTNTTPMSQPQQDDDIEVFFDTGGPAKTSGRAPTSYQMAVSAGNGAYFSVGGADRKPQAKLVFTYKYSAAVDGTLNKNNDTDIGYTIELAIPWRELGQTAPPKAGTVWSFNVINRDRDSTAHPADRLASLSEQVRKASDVQDALQWTRITFTDSLTSQHSGPNMVYCPRVQGHFPIIDGVVRSGEWFRADGFTLGSPTTAAPAPTIAEEPNVNVTEDQAFQQAVAQTPPPTIVDNGDSGGGNKSGDNGAPPATSDNGAVPGPTPQQPAPPAQPAQTASNPDYDVELPGGGTVHIGKMRPPPAPPMEATPTTTPSDNGGGKRGKNRRSRGSQTAQLPTGQFGPQFPAVGPDVNPTQALRLLEQPRPSQLFAALYRLTFAPNERFVDQPVSGMGSWFGGGSVQYHIDQLADARRAGVDMLLVQYDPSSPESNSALASLVQALQELRAQGQDYPLLGVYATNSGDAYAAVRAFFERVPPEFRAEVILPDAQNNRPAFVAVVPGGADAGDLQKRFAADFAGEGAGLFVANPAADGGLAGATGGVPLTSALVTPVADPTKPVSDRDQGASYNSAWGSADASHGDWVVLDSWNDYARGTEAAATRQYGEHYADLTKIYSQQWNGGQEWHARYLKCNAPAVMSPNTLYTIQVRVENAGTLPWRLGEDYGLSYRWYKDGRLYDDSAPKLPVSTDIYPGQSMDVGVGILPHNQYGNPLESGDYVLVFDMVQGNDRWFTLAGDIGLKVHIHITGPGESVPARATFVDSTLPTRIQAGMSYVAVVTVRNDTNATWKAGKAALTYQATALPGVLGLSDSGSAVLPADVDPGAIATIKVPVKLGGAGAENGSRWQVKWAMSSPAVEGHLVQNVNLVPTDTGASFVLNDVPRDLKTGQNSSARLGVANRGTRPWTSGRWQIGYHWAYLDGTPVPGVSPVMTPIKGEVQPNVVTAVTAKFQTPDYPGRYFLVFDVRDSEGQWSSEYGQKMHPHATLPVMVTVTAGGASRARLIDLGKLFNVTAAGFEGVSAGDFDGNGDTIPGEQLPPDGTDDTVSNPVLTGKPGPADYPSGFYAGPGAADHSVAFHFPDRKDAADAVACHGQRIDLPGGFTTIHLLAASTGNEPVAATFTVDGTPQTLAIAPWTQNPAAGAAVGLRFPYHLHAGVVDTTAPCIFGDYTLQTPNGARALILPDDASIKILAMTVAK